MQNKPKRREIWEPWEVSQDKPNPYEPYRFKQENILPYLDDPKGYVKYVNKYHPQAMQPFDDFKLAGHLTSAELIDGDVWVIFTPEKFAGKYWVHYA